MRSERTYAAIIKLLSDRRWHHIQELSRVSRYPDRWARELVREGVVDTSEEGSTQVLRLRSGA